ncbi:MAG: dethiobiotin synthase [Pseudomonadota bacterium]
MTICTAKGVFVTGTDTGVGKTIVAGAFARALVLRGLKISVMKPVETGCLFSADQTHDASAETLVPKDALYLLEQAKSDALLDLVNPYRFGPPLCPSVAAQLCHQSIDLKHILSCFEQLQEESNFVIVESAGGVLVPLSGNLLTIELIKATGLPALVIGRSSLGTINHCLLTLEALCQRQIPIAGVILNRLSQNLLNEESTNPQQIEKFFPDVIRGVLPFFDSDQRRDPDFMAERLRIHVDLDRIIHFPMQNRSNTESRISSE